MLSAISRRNAVLHCAASSNVRGGTKRLLVRPGIDALAITAIPQVGTAALSVSAMAVRMTPPMPRDNSHPGEPIVSAVFPKPPGKAVGHEYRRDPLRILEPELGRNAQLERIAVARRQDLVGNLEGEKGLRVQRRRHVDAGVISVGALEADIFRGQVRADALQEGSERDPGPFADHAPAFDANVPRHLRLLRQLVEFWQRPRSSAIDQAGQIELVASTVDLGDFILPEIGVVTKVLDRLAFRIRRHQALGIEDRSLGAVVPSRNAVEHALNRAGIGNVAAGQQRQSTEAETLLEKEPALDLTHGTARAEERFRFSAVGQRLGAEALAHGLVLAVRFVRACAASDHGRQRLRNDDDERNMHYEERDDRGHAEEMDYARHVEAAEQPGQLLKLA